MVTVTVPDADKTSTKYLTAKLCYTIIHSFIVFLKSIRQNADVTTRVVNIANRQYRPTVCKILYSVVNLIHIFIQQSRDKIAM